MPQPVTFRPPPNWMTGFARGAGESAHPGLWRGLQIICPLGMGTIPGHLGATGDGEFITNFDGVFNKKYSFVASGAATDNFVQTRCGLAHDNGGNGDRVNTPAIVSGTPLYKLPAAPGMTISALCKPTGYGGTGNGALCGFYPASQGFIWYERSSSSSWSFLCRKDGAVDQYTWPISLNEWQCVSLTYTDDDANQPKMYKNGAELTRTTVSSTANSYTNDDSGDKIGFTNRGDDSTKYFDGQVSVVLLWDRILSHSELQTLAVDPWCPLRMVEDEELPLFVAAAAGGGNIPEMVHNMRRRQVA